MAPSNASNPQLETLRSLGYEVSAGEGRTRAQQAAFQLAALGVTLGIAIVGGVITGLFMRLNCLFPPEDGEEDLFEDSIHWELNPGAPESQSSEIFSPQHHGEGQQIRYRTPVQQQ